MKMGLFATQSKDWGWLAGASDKLWDTPDLGPPIVAITPRPFLSVNSDARWMSTLVVKMR